MNPKTCLNQADFYVCLCFQISIFNFFFIQIYSLVLNHLPDDTFHLHLRIYLNWHKMFLDPSRPVLKKFLPIVSLKKKKKTKTLTFNSWLTLFYPMLCLWLSLIKHFRFWHLRKYNCIWMTCIFPIADIVKYFV